MISSIKWKNIKFPGGKKVLGLSIDEKCIYATEMHHDGEGFHEIKSACLEFTENVSFSTPARLGELLGQFIRDNGLTAKRAVIGIPAKWVMIREKNMPPSSGASVTGIVRIHAEHELSINPDDLVIDYTGNISSDKSSRLSIGAALRKNYENVLESLGSAGLKVMSVTVSVMSLGSIVSGHAAQSHPEIFILLRPDYAEVLVGDSNQIVDIKHIQLDRKGGTAFLISCLKRIISFSRVPEKTGEMPGLMILDLSDTDENYIQDIHSALSSMVDITVCDELSLMKKMNMAGAPDSKEYLPSAAIIQGYYLKDSSYMDFCNSRMNEKVVRIKKNQVMWASAIAICLIIIVLNMIYTWESDKRNVAELKQKLADINEDVQSARAVVQKMDYARKWYSDRPEVLRCLYELTMAFPVEGRIWATNLAINEEMNGIVSGRAVDEKSVIEVLDGLKTNSLFDNVQMIYLRETGQSSQEVSFSVSFLFRNRGL